MYVRILIYVYIYVCVDMYIDLFIYIYMYTQRLIQDLCHQQYGSYPPTPHLQMASSLAASGPGRGSDIRTLVGSMINSLLCNLES